MKKIIGDGFGTFVEVGPGNVLSGLMRRIDREVKVFGAGNKSGLEAAITALEG